MLTSCVLLCVVLNLLPQHGPPEFRYTGADPAHAVWNLGWPMALVIYDPRSGFHFGPSLYVAPLFQIPLGLLISGMMFLRR